MDTTKALSVLNLNLLPALQALVSERNVSAAARRMGVSQSAMSHALAKLRAALDDELLVVSGRAMVPTPRAVELATTLPPVLESLSRVLAGPEHFDPSTANTRLRIATLDYFELAVLPGVLAFLQAHAPGVRLELERLDDRSGERLARGEIDFAFGGEGMAMPSPLVQRRLYNETFSTIVRPDHPRVRTRLTMTRYLELGHVLVSVEGKRLGVVDRILAQRGARRRVAVRVPHFATAALAVLESDFVCTLPSLVARRAQELFGVRVFKPPIPVPPIGVVAWWPRQHRNDPARRWFREQLLSGGAMSPELRRLMNRRDET